MSLSAPERRSDTPDVSRSPRAFTRPHPRSFLFEAEDPPAPDRALPDGGEASPGGTDRAGSRDAARPSRAIFAWLGIAFALVALAAAPRLRPLLGPTAGASAAGTLVVESQPAGWQVWDGDVDRGVTPLTVVLPAGRRRLVLRRGPEMREVQVEVTPGARTVYHVELTSAAPRSSGDLRVSTKPPGAIVAVDGIGRGESPVDVRDLEAGRHVVTVLSGDKVVSETVTIEAGRSAALVVPINPRGEAVALPPAIGWVEVRARVPLEVYEGESLVGNGRNPRVVLKPGRHTLRLSNGELNLAATRTVDVRPGGTAAVAIDLPPGNLSVNAVPWAEVWLDGERIGETPLANFPAPVGSHELLLKHPTLGERRRTIVVAAGVATRVGVSLRE